jgi:hypothetical protein
MCDFAFYRNRYNYTIALQHYLPDKKGLYGGVGKKILEGIPEIDRTRHVSLVKTKQAQLASCVRPKVRSCLLH